MGDRTARPCRVRCESALTAASLAVGTSRAERGLRRSPCLLREEYVGQLPWPVPPPCQQCLEAEEPGALGVEESEDKKLRLADPPTPITATRIAPPGRSCASGVELRVAKLSLGRVVHSRLGSEEPGRNEWNGTLAEVHRHTVLSAVPWGSGLAPPCCSQERLSVR